MTGEEFLALALGLIAIVLAWAWENWRPIAMVALGLTIVVQLAHLGAQLQILLMAVARLVDAKQNEQARREDTEFEAELIRDFGSSASDSVQSKLDVIDYKLDEIYDKLKLS